MEKSSFFNSVNGDRRYKAEDFASYFASFISNGVMPQPSSGLQVITGADGLKIKIKPGKAWINGYYMRTEQEITKTLANADGVLKRIDRVVVRWSLSDRTITLQVKKGTFASNPVAPTLQRDSDIFELALADIAIAPGAVNISQSAITDQRLNGELCGVSVGIINQVDTTAFNAQLQAWMQEYKGTAQSEFQTWITSVQDVLDQNAAGNLLNQINALKTSKANLNSPAFTGTPTAPTQVRTNKSTRIATTAFVHSMYHSATVTIDTTGWVAVTGKGNYKFKKDIAVTGCTVKSDARLNYTVESKQVAIAAKADYIETEANKVVVYAEKVPTAAMTASLFVYLGV